MSTETVLAPVRARKLERIVEASAESGRLDELIVKLPEKVTSFVIADVSTVGTPDSTFTVSPALAAATPRSIEAEFTVT
jgi:hypothetical protein